MLVLCGCHAGLSEQRSQLAAVALVVMADNPPWWELMGWPARNSPVPSDRQHARRSCCWWLHAACNGRMHVSISFWRCLWRVLHCTLPPTHISWEELCGQFTLQDFPLGSQTNGQKSIAGLVSWNVGWMVAAQTRENAAKKATVIRWLTPGFIACLQELHWDDVSMGIWSSQFNSVTVISSVAGVANSQGRVPRVVAVVVPHEYEVMNMFDNEVDDVYVCQLLFVRHEAGQDHQCVLPF